MKLSNLIKDQDMFGHSIKLNFKQKGDSHNTFIGGFFSLFIKAALMFYVFSNFKKMIMNEEDKNFTENGVVEQGKSETVLLN